MPEKTLTYYVGEEVYDIPESKKDAFLNKYPDAEERKSYIVGKDTFDIPTEAETTFLNKYPDAQATFGVKKKDVGPSASASVGFDISKEELPSPDIKFIHADLPRSTHDEVDGVTTLGDFLSSQKATLKDLGFSPMLNPELPLTRNEMDDYRAVLLNNKMTTIPAAPQDYDIKPVLEKTKRQIELENMDKGEKKREYLATRVFDESVTGKLLKPVIGKIAGLSKEERLTQDELARMVTDPETGGYDPTMLQDVATGLLVIMSDMPVFKGLGKLTTKGPVALYNKLIGAGFSSTQASQAIVGAINMSGILGAYSGLNESLNQKINEGKTIPEIDWGQVAKEAGVSAGTGALVGLAGTGTSILSSSVGTKGLINSRIAQEGVKLGINTAGLAGESAAFAYGPALFDREQKLSEVNGQDYLESLATIFGLKAMHLAPKEPPKGRLRSASEVNAIEKHVKIDELWDKTKEDSKLTDAVMNDPDVPWVAKAEIAYNINGTPPDAWEPVVRRVDVNETPNGWEVVTYDINNNRISVSDRLTRKQAVDVGLKYRQVIDENLTMTNLKNATIDQVDAIDSRLREMGYENGVDNERLNDALTTNVNDRTPRQQAEINDLMFTIKEGLGEKWITYEKPAKETEPETITPEEGEVVVEEQKPIEQAETKPMDIVSEHTKFMKSRGNKNLPSKEESDALLERVKEATGWTAENMQIILDKHLVFPINKREGFGSQNVIEYAFIPKPTDNTGVRYVYREYDIDKKFPEPYLYDKRVVDKEGNIIDGRYERYDRDYRSGLSEEVDSEHLFRGMSGDEFNSVINSGRIESNKRMNLGGQEETTSFAQYPRQAFNYASGFTAWFDMAEFDNPRYVVKVSRGEADISINIAGEADVKGSIPSESITDIWEVRLAEASPGHVEIKESFDGVISDGGRSPASENMIVRKLTPEEVNLVKQGKPIKEGGTENAETNGRKPKEAGTEEGTQEGQQEVERLRVRDNTEVQEGTSEVTPPEPPGEEPPEGEQRTPEDALKGMREQRKEEFKRLRKKPKKWSYLVYDQYAPFKSKVRKTGSRRTKLGTLITDQPSQRFIDRKIIEGGIGEKTQKDFREAMRKIVGPINRMLTPKEIDLASEYANLKRTSTLYKERRKQGKPELKEEYEITEAEADKILSDIDNKAQYILDEFGLKDYDPKKILRAVEGIDAENKRILDYLHNNGIVGQEAYDQLKDIFYSKRKYMQFQNKIDRGGSISGIDPLKEGSIEAKDIDFPTLLADAWLRANSVVARTRTARAGEEFINTHPDNGFMKQAPYSNEFKTKLKEQSKLPEEEREWVEPEFKDTPKDMVNINYIGEDGMHKRTWMDKDIYEYYKVQPYSDGWIKAMNWASWLSGTRVLKMAATGYNPEFMVKNVPLDMQHILLTTDAYSPVLPVASIQILKDMVYVTKRFKRLTKEYIDEGGGMGGLMTGSMGEGIRSEGTKKYTKQNRAIDALMDAVKTPGNYSEMVTRLALRNRSIQNGITDFKKANNRNPNAKELKEIQLDATARARDYLDFKQGGRITKGADAVVPYLNAGMQVTRGALRAAKNNPALFAAKSMQLASMAAGLSIWNYGRRDDEYPVGLTEEEKAAFDEKKANLKEMGDAYNTGIHPNIKARNFILMTPSFYVDDNGNKRYAYVKFEKDNMQELISGIAEDMVMESMKAKDDRMWGKAILNEKRAIELWKSMQSFANVAQLSPSVRAFMGYGLNKDLYRKNALWPGGDRGDYRDFGIDKSLEKWQNTPERYKVVGQIPIPIISTMTKDKDDPDSKGFRLSPVRTEYFVDQFLTESNVLVTGIGELMDIVIAGLGHDDGTYDPTQIEKLAKTPGLRRFVKFTSPYVKQTMTDDEQQKYNREKYIDDLTFNDIVGDSIEVDMDEKYRKLVDYELNIMENNDLGEERAMRLENKWVDKENKLNLQNKYNRFKERDNAVTAKNLYDYYKTLNDDEKMQMERELPEWDGYSASIDNTFWRLIQSEKD